MPPESVSPSLKVVILAGGKSRRMGIDKALIKIDGVTLLEHMCAAASQSGFSVLVVGRSAPTTGNFFDASFMKDDVSGLGPMGGIATALRQTGGDILTLACDQPYVTTEAIRWLASKNALHPEGEGIVTAHCGMLEPMFTIYRQRCRALIEKRIAESKFALHELIKAADFAWVEIPEQLTFTIQNLNTPEDFNRVLAPPT